MYKPSEVATISVLGVLCAGAAGGCVALGVLLHKAQAQAQAQAQAPQHKPVAVPAPVDTQAVVRTLPNFLSDAEADHMVRLAKDRFAPSITIDKITGERVQSKDRTSTSAFLQHAEDKVVASIEARAAAQLGLPLSHLEQLQVVRYEPGQFYRAHYDYIDAHTADVKTNGQRVATMFVYLNTLPDDEPGGGTEFPKLGITIQPRKGTAAMWDNVDRKTGALDPRTLHAGKPVTKAVKYGLNIWFREQPQP